MGAASNPNSEATPNHSTRDTIIIATVLISSIILSLLVIGTITLVHRRRSNANTHVVNKRKSKATESRKGSLASQIATAEQGGHDPVGSRPDVAITSAMSSIIELDKIERIPTSEVRFAMPVTSQSEEVDSGRGVNANGPLDSHPPTPVKMGQAIVSSSWEAPADWGVSPGRASFGASLDDNRGAGAGVVYGVLPDNVLSTTICLGPAPTVDEYRARRLGLGEIGVAR